VEGAPDTMNVVYIDEYPELKKRVWLRRLAAGRLSGVIDFPQIIEFPKPDGAA
jgi:hypothetical protein